MLLIVHADSGLENIHGVTPQAFRYGHGFNSAIAGIVPERFQDEHHGVDLSQLHPSFGYSARHLLPNEYVSSTRDPLQEPLGPKSMESVEAKRAAMAQDLEHISDSSQTDDNHTGGHLLAIDRKSYRTQASKPGAEGDRSMLMSDLLLGEGYGHRDSQDSFQETRIDPVPQDLAPQEAKSEKRPSVAGSPSDTKKTRGQRAGPLTAEGKAHANRVKKRGRKGCIHKRKKRKVTPRRYESPITPQTC